MLSANQFILSCSAVHANNDGINLTLGHKDCSLSISFGVKKIATFGVGSIETADIAYIS